MPLYLLSVGYQHLGVGPILKSSLFPRGNSFVEIKFSSVSCSSQWETAFG